MADIYSEKDLATVIVDGEIRTSVVLRGSGVKSLGCVQVVHGDLGLSDSALESLGELREIRGDFWLSHHTITPRLRSLGKLQKVRGNASLAHWMFTDLGELSEVGGNLSLRDSEVSSLGKLSYVGGNLSLPSTFKDDPALSGITVGGKTTFWKMKRKEQTEGIPDNLLIKYEVPIPEWPHSYIYGTQDLLSAPAEAQSFYQRFRDDFFKGIYLDLEGYENYAFVLLYDLQDRLRKTPDALCHELEALGAHYPQTRPFADDAIMHLPGVAAAERTKKKLIEGGNFSAYHVRHFEDVQRTSLIDADIAIRMAPRNLLTSFGINNAEEIKPFLFKRVKDAENRFGVSFLDIFFDHGLPYKRIDGTYHPDYYEQFFHDKEAYQFYKGLDDQHVSGGYFWAKIFHVVEHAVTEYLSSLFRLAEDDYRVSVGIPKIGEGWVSETDLYYKVKARFQDHEVVQHGRPKWLGRQHLDIFFPDDNVAIEYQGLQHYKPVSIFGGEVGLSATQARDKRKADLCKKNHCKLIYVDESHSFEEVIKMIESALNL